MSNTRAILKFKSEFKISHFIAPVKLCKAPCEALGILEFPKKF
nr:hypothetical protein [uncultured Campylobacter sp.]